jgi:hypothetical protein
MKQRLEMLDRQATDPDFKSEEPVSHFYQLSFSSGLPCGVSTHSILFMELIYLEQNGYLYKNDLQTWSPNGLVFSVSGLSIRLHLTIVLFDPASSPHMDGYMSSIREEVEKQ